LFDLNIIDFRGGINSKKARPFLGAPVVENTYRLISFGEKNLKRGTIKENKWKKEKKEDR
jgi:hypothetical protein